jgi:hypothetical protein
MLLILAHSHDSAARALAARWGGEALLLMVGDLARWRLDVDPAGGVRAGLATAEGTPVPVTGVVNRLGVLTGADLPRVRREDRPYAAAELTAFLLAWLDACPAPVLNPPNPRCLNGPAWYPEQWADAAASVGLRVPAVHREVGLAAEPRAAAPEWTEGRRVHVVGDVCVGDVHPSVGRRLGELARLAETPLMTATVSGPGPRAEVRELSAWPDLAEPEVADAVLAALAGAAGGEAVAAAVLAGAAGGGVPGPAPAGAVGLGESLGREVPADAAVLGEAAGDAVPGPAPAESATPVAPDLAVVAR